MYLYAGDAKIYSTISSASANDSDCLQRVIDRVKYWCYEWLLPLNHTVNSSSQSVNGDIAIQWEWSNFDHS